MNNNENNCNELIERFKSEEKIWASKSSISVRKIDTIFAPGEKIGFDLNLFNIDDVLILEFNLKFPSKCIDEGASSALVLSNGEILKYKNGSGSNCNSEYTINISDVFENDGDKKKLSENTIVKLRINMSLDYFVIDLDEDTQTEIKNIISCLIKK